MFSFEENDFFPPQISQNLKSTNFDFGLQKLLGRIEYDW